MVLVGFVLSVETYCQLWSTLVDSNCYNTKCLDRVNDLMQSLWGYCTVGTFINIIYKYKTIKQLEPKTIRFVKILQDLAWQNLIKRDHLTRFFQDLTKSCKKSYQHLDKILPTSFQDLTKIFPRSYKILPRSYKILSASWQDLTKILLQSYKIFPRSYKILQDLTRSYKILQDLASILTRSYQHLSKILPRSCYDLTRYKILQDIDLAKIL